jgi:hypothetical protein
VPRQLDAQRLNNRAHLRHPGHAAGVQAEEPRRADVLHRPQRQHVHLRRRQRASQRTDERLQPSQSHERLVRRVVRLQHRVQHTRPHPLLLLKRGRQHPHSEAQPLRVRRANKTLAVGHSLGAPAAAAAETVVAPTAEQLCQLLDS